MIHFRGCAAAIRLDMYTNGTQADLGNLYQPLIARILQTVVANKLQTKAERPFFTVRKLDAIEDELGIGIYSSENYKCNGCGIDRTSNRSCLYTCSGRKRVWYCSQKCNRKYWLTQHRPNCKGKWREKDLPLKRPKIYNKIIKFLEEADDSGQAFIDKEPKTGEVFFYCKDPNTGEIFDALSDRLLPYPSALYDD